MSDPSLTQALSPLAGQLSDPDLWRQDAFIDGAWVQAPQDARFEVTNPATGDVLASVADLGGAQTDQAIAAAHAAWKPWESRTAKDRAAILRRWFELIMAAQEDLAQICTAECGKPLAESRGEVAYAASFIEWFAEEAKRDYGDVIPQHQPDKRLLVLRQAVGVIGAITPWNFPLAMITRKVAPALAAGCTAVVKPAELTPLSALAMAELAQRAGIPAGVLNIVTGSDSKAIGEALTGSDLVRKITFTGSTEVGRLLMRASADTIKKVSFELGGNAPFIVFDDADLDAAVEGAIICKFRNAGQTCVCANRIYVQDAIYDAFAEKFAARVKAMTVGDGAAPGTEIGPLISPAGIDKIERHMADATSRGAVVATGGARHNAGALFFQPTVLTEVTQEMLVAREESFGPIAPLFRFSDEADVIAKANDTIFGLASYFYARDLGRVWRVAEALEYGMVAVNSGILSTEVAPFGGVKQSGLGREGSRYGLDEYTEIKYVMMGGITPS
ncbi:MAG: NAD-dependent succinate-semialdehyde dehydrogenase [Neomegalonema sp.]|nr:NAD-dependent succinate-semialdehyde dehydrogenase [Neomegalonema sp.]